MTYDYAPAYSNMLGGPAYWGIGYLVGILELYVKAHRPLTRPFLRAVVANDLFAAYKVADKHDIEVLPALIRFIVDVVPAAAYGSEQRVKDWLSSWPQEETSE